MKRKKCISCKCRKVTEAFSKDRQNADGLRHYCRDCVSKRYSKTDKYRKRRLDYYKAHKQQYKDYYKRNRNYHTQKSYEWAALNPEKVKTASRKMIEKYKIQRPGMSAHNTRLSELRRHKTRSNCVPKWLTKDQLKTMEQIYAFRAIQQMESPVLLHVDHIIPIHGTEVCGLHVPWNLQIITASDNCKKSNKIL